MQLKAQHPTLGNEATGTKQPAPEKLGAGNGSNWLFHPSLSLGKALDLSGVEGWQHTGIVLRTVSVPLPR